MTSVNFKGKFERVFYFLLPRPETKCPTITGAFLQN